MRYKIATITVQKQISNP